MRTAFEQMMVRRGQMSLQLSLICLTGLGVALGLLRWSYLVGSLIVATVGLLLLGVSIGAAVGRVFTGCLRGTIGGAISGATGIVGAWAGFALGLGINMALGLQSHMSANRIHVVIFYTCTTLGFLLPLVLFGTYSKRDSRSNLTS